MGTKKSAVVSRYNLLTGLLLTFFLAAAGTFCYEINQFQQTTVTFSATEPSAGITGLDIHTGTGDSTSNPVSSVVISFLNAHSEIIVLGWLCIIAFRCFQLFIGFRGIYLLKKTQTSSAGEYWTNRVTELASLLGITQPVKLLQSAIAKVPLVTGHFKPVILLPAGILTSLPTDEIEAILLHELAHIRRRDFLVNVLQSFCDILFFFNPAVLWVSGLVKEERENCCDDIAIGHVKSRKKFIHALIAFQEYHSSANQYAVTFPGRRHHLLNRVKRILTNNNKTLNTMEKLLLVSGLAVTSFVVIAFTQNSEKGAVNKKQPVEMIAAASTNLNFKQDIILQDTVPSKERRDKITNIYSVTTYKSGKEYKFKLDGDKVSDLYIDGVRIPDDKIADYKTELDEMIKKLMKESERARAMSEEARLQADLARAQADLLRDKLLAEQEYLAKAKEDMANNRALQEKHKSLSADRLRYLKEKIREVELTRDRSADEKILLDKYMSEAFQEKEMAEKLYFDNDLHKQKERELYEQKLFHQKEMELFRDQSEKMRLKADEHRLFAEKERLFTEERRKKAEVSRKKSQQLVKDIMDDLTKEGLIKESDDEVSFLLDNNMLIVNGEKQSEALQKKLAKKYLKGMGDHITYSATANSSHTDIHIDKQEQ